MAAYSKERFVLAIFRIKKIPHCITPANSLQPSELAVLHKAAGGCKQCETGYSVSEIQSTLHITKPAVSQILNGLEKKGYIARTIDAGDRRKIMVTLTQRGAAELEKAVRCQDAMLNAVFEQFGEERMHMFLELSEALMDIIENMEYI